MRVFFVLLVLMQFYSCVPDAPHDNPVDPANNLNINEINFSGSVFSFYQPFSGIEAAQIEIVEAGRKTMSDDQGFFRFGKLLKGTYTIITSKNLYQTDTLILELYTDLENQIINLNALPHISSFNYFSENRSGSMNRP